MIEEPTIVHTAAQKIAAVHVTCSREEIQAVMGPGYKELMDTLQAQGIVPAGPWLTHHFRMDPAIFDFEIAVPVSAEVTAAGRVTPGELPRASSVRTIYHGPYEGLPQAWGEFDAWIQQRGQAVAPDLVEIYLVGPESGTDGSKWQTELRRPLAT